MTTTSTTSFISRGEVDKGERTKKRPVVDVESIDVQEKETHTCEGEPARHKINVKPPCMYVCDHGWL